MEKLVANLSSKVHKKTLQGRSYLVAPVAMILEGVFAGSEGPVLYEAAEIQKSVAAWNGRPITIGHPELPNGTKVSGCTQEALETRGIGMILNTRFNKSSKKLVAEAWIEESRLNDIPGGMDVQDALAVDMKLEVSTGLFIDAVVANGSHGGKAYGKKATNFVPDHLAILLDQEGACSLKDGAGLLVNKGTVQQTAGIRPAILAANAGESLSKLVRAVGDAVWKDHYVMGEEDKPGVYPYVEEVFKNEVVFEKSGKLYKQNYEAKSGSVKLIGDLTEVIRKVSYTPLVANAKANMTREELTAALGEDQKDFVANLSDEQVAAIAKLKTVVAPVAPVAPVVTPVAPVVNSMEDWIKAAPAALQTQINDVVVANQRLRDGYVTSIVANKANTFSKEELESFPTLSLEKLAGLAVANSDVAPEHKTPIYAGQPVANSKVPVTETGFSIPSTFTPKS